MLKLQIIVENTKTKETELKNTIINRANILFAYASHKPDESVIVTEKGNLIINSSFEELEELLITSR